MKIHKIILLICFLFYAVSNSKLIAKPTAQSKTQCYFYLSPICPLCQYYTKEILTLFQKFTSDSIQFKLVFPGKYSKDEIEMFVTNYDLTTIKTKIDKRYKLAKKHNVKVVPQTIILNKHKIVYSGLINDAFIQINQRNNSTINNYTENVLINIQNNINIKFTQTEPMGCILNTKF